MTGCFLDIQTIVRLHFPEYNKTHRFGSIELRKMVVEALQISDHDTVLQERKGSLDILAAWTTRT